MPFLENVTRGRGVPRERLAEVAHHYDLFGGVSPINQQCRDLMAAIEKDFAVSGLDLPVYWGNRNWAPYLADTVAAMAADGVRRAVAFVTSAYGSYSSCRQYLDDIEAARAQAGPGAPEIDKIRHYFNHPGFIEPVTEATLAAAGSLPPAVAPHVPLVFTAHSVPETMAAASGPSGGLYPAQLTEAARLVAAGVAAATGHERPWQLVYQSRSGPPSAALARPGRVRPPGRPRPRRRAGRGAGPGRLHLRPPGGGPRPRRGGGRGRAAARTAPGPGSHTGHAPSFRIHDHRARPRADGRGAVPPGAGRARGSPGCVPWRLLPAPRGRPWRGPAGAQA